MKRRSTLEIIFRILDSISKEQLPLTQIMYKAGLNYYQVKRYLDHLLQRELVRKVEHQDAIKYSITQEGREVLRNFRLIEEKLLSD